MFTPGKGIAVVIFGLFVWITGGPLLLWITCIVGLFVLFILTIRFVGGWIDVVIEDCTEWDDG